MTVEIDPEGTESRYLHRYAEFDFGDMRVLEIGCGDGRLTWQYARSARHVTGVDLLADDLRVALIERPADLTGRVSFVRADARHLPFENGSFDLAVFAWSF